MYIEDINGTLIKEDRIVSIFKTESGELRAEVDGILGHVVLSRGDEDKSEKLLNYFRYKDSPEIHLSLISDRLEDLNKILRELKQEIDEVDEAFCGV